MKLKFQWQDNQDSSSKVCKFENKHMLGVMGITSLIHAMHLPCFQVDQGGDQQGTFAISLCSLE